MELMYSQFHIRVVYCIRRRHSFVLFMTDTEKMSKKICDLKGAGLPPLRKLGESSEKAPLLSRFMAALPPIGRARRNTGETEKESGRRVFRSPLPPNTTATDRQQGLPRPSIAVKGKGKGNMKQAKIKTGNQVNSTLKPRPAIPPRPISNSNPKSTKKRKSPRRPSTRAAAEDTANEDSNGPDFGQEDECPICFEIFRDPQKLPCGHWFCKGCVQELRQNACPTCREPLPDLLAAHVGRLVIEDDRRTLEAERWMIIEAMGGLAKGCPGCGNVIEKVDGDHQVMCGCEAKPAGGTMAKALAGGGCGHCFNFTTGAPIEYGRPGNPYNERQVYF